MDMEAAAALGMPLQLLLGVQAILILGRVVVEVPVVPVLPQTPDASLRIYLDLMLVPDKLVVHWVEALLVQPELLKQV